MQYNKVFIYGKQQICKKDKLRNLFILCPLYYVKAFRDSNLKPQKTWADSVKFQTPISETIHSCYDCVFAFILYIVML